MNISPDGVTVRFKTASKDLFEAEKSGAKSNTVHIMDLEEWRLLRKCDPKKIIIQHQLRKCDPKKIIQHQQEIFLRTITNIHFGGVLLGKVIGIISWSNEIVRDPYANTMSLDNQSVTEDNASEIRCPHVHTMPSYNEPAEDRSTAPILLPRALISNLMSNRGTRTLPEFISELLADYEAHLENRDRDPAEEEEDKKLALIGISKGMSDKLVRLAYDRSMDAVIRELYQIYLDKHAEEVGPLHD